MFIAGIIFWGGFNTAMDVSNTKSFCISCHVMKDNVYEEYTDTIHYNNRTGIRAVRSDCHEGVAHELPEGYESGDNAKSVAVAKTDR